MLALATMIVGLETRPSFAVTQTAPFTECPAVGDSPSCAILVVINADRTVTVYDDPNVGPYDGIEDTLVGVRNDSPDYVEAITVVGPGTDLAGFDGDGLCTYGITGCPFGPTGYEGPGTSFVVEPSRSDAVEVDFADGGLGPRGSTYFSLEDVLTHASLIVRQGHLGGYVALGDSYSSGEGSGFYNWNSDLPRNQCHRSGRAYGVLLDSDRTLGQMSFAACSGAITADVFEPNHEGNIDINTDRPEAAQIDALSPFTRTVTLTVGGNDVGFEGVLTRCVIGRVAIMKKFGSAGCSKDTSLRQKVDGRLNALAGTGSAQTDTGIKIRSLHEVLAAIHRASPNARIYLATYPRLFGTFRGECGIGTVYVNKVPGVGYAAMAMKITGPDAAWLNTLSDRFANVAADAVKTAHEIDGIDVQVVNVDPKFSGHRLCDTSETWIAPIAGTAAYNAPPEDAVIASGSFHPTPTGQQHGYEAAFLDTDIGR
jgi:hypothetical protein